MTKLVLTENLGLPADVEAKQYFNIFSTIFIWQKYFLNWYLSLFTELLQWDSFSNYYLDCDFENWAPESRFFLIMMSLRFLTVWKVCTDTTKNSKHCSLKINRSHPIGFLLKSSNCLKLVSSLQNNAKMFVISCSNISWSFIFILCRILMRQSKV